MYLYAAFAIALPAACLLLELDFPIAALLVGIQVVAALTAPHLLTRLGFVVDPRYCLTALLTLQGVLAGLMVFGVVCTILSARRNESYMWAGMACAAGLVAIANVYVWYRAMCIDKAVADDNDA